MILYLPEVTLKKKIQGPVNVLLNPSQPRQEATLKIDSVPDGPGGSRVTQPGIQVSASPACSFLAALSELSF